MEKEYFLLVDSKTYGCGNMSEVLGMIEEYSTHMIVTNKHRTTIDIIERKQVREKND